MKCESGSVVVVNRNYRKFPKHPLKISDRTNCTNYYLYAIYILYRYNKAYRVNNTGKHETMRVENHSSVVGILQRLSAKFVFTLIVFDIRYNVL